MRLQKYLLNFYTCCGYALLLINLVNVLKVYMIFLRIGDTSNCSACAPCHAMYSIDPCTVRNTLLCRVDCCWSAIVTFYLMWKLSLIARSTGIRWFFLMYFSRSSLTNLSVHTVDDNYTSHAHKHTRMFSGPFVDSLVTESEKEVKYTHILRTWRRILRARIWYVKTTCRWSGIKLLNHTFYWYFKICVYDNVIAYGFYLGKR